MNEKLYLIPGTMCDERLWSYLAPYLSDSIELVYLTIPPYKNFEELAEYYAELIKSTLCEEGKINLVGFSLGGYIASYFSVLYPELIKKLFIISNSPTRLPDTEIEQRNNIVKSVKKHGYKGIARSRITHLLDEANHVDKIIDIIFAMDKTFGQKELLSQYQNTSQRKDLFDALNHASFPVHFYCSEGDPLVDAKWFDNLMADNLIFDNPSASDVKQKAPKLSLIRTSGAGHMLPLEKPEELVNYLKLWLTL